MGRPGVKDASHGFARVHAVTTAPAVLAGCPKRPLANATPRHGESIGTDHRHAHGGIEEPTPAGATFRLTPQGLDAELGTDDHVTVWHYHPEQLALGRYTGRITRVDRDTAAFAIRRADVDEYWPAGIDPTGAGAGLPGPARLLESHTSRTAATAAPETIGVPGRRARGVG